MKKPTFLLISLFTVLAFAACSDGLDNIEYDRTSDVVVATPQVAATTSTSLTVTSSVTGNLNNVVMKGFCYSVNAQTPTIKDNIVEADENFSATITGLSGSTSYYIRAYAYGNSRYTYSDVLTATTESLSLNEQLENYVAPTYEDNYTGIAGWDQRSKWNLANVHDPSVMKADDGYYYMYQTDASYGNAHDGHGHFHGRRSKDLVNWEYLGGTMTDTPSWIKTKLNEYRATQGLDPIENPSYGYWAPVARKVSSGKYRMYYSVVIDNYIKTGATNTTANFDNSWTERAFIGLMETSDPAGNVWEDKGFVVCSSSDRGMNEWTRTSTGDWSGYFKWNAIDPSYIITNNNEHWLIYGSWHSGIAALQLDASTGKPLSELGVPWDITEESTYGKLIYKRGATSRWQGSEAPEVIYNPETGYFYLFMAYDGLAVPYNTRVARAESITGPYYGINGADITTSNEILPIVTHPYKFNNSYGWVGIAHCAVFDDGNGNWYYASQGRLPENISGINASNAVMMGHIRSIQWNSQGWPVVMPERYGAVPKVAITEDELVGNWEHIDLSYSYGKQKESSNMTLAADHTITAGTWKGGTWSFDAEKQILTANGVELCLQREVDWEAQPRTHTIVYAGYTTSKTYWGKKW
ncbi:arabinan endo-1,5-alpha-L-arabinosidase [Bacteroides sp. 51]|uniref:arabinan endo-1,5-alpha-L-arabinosidase n=1 Tax=Bacteroides sp. 51 TaxID=2302938 RepID=UPI0013D51F1A|nr:arabinan endo-1,5-alpha-L-arabinosidase [Bacteroides sp. 51]NDV81439.1 arabinan endo-1,5-alpha-L-arabinosidase [Bacteroides sp. 51]